VDLKFRHAGPLNPFAKRRDQLINGRSRDRRKKQTPESGNGYTTKGGIGSY
jgi:hypothetical protein